LSTASDRARLLAAFRQRRRNRLASGLLVGGTSEEGVRIASEQSLGRDPGRDSIVLDVIGRTSRRLRRRTHLSLDRSNTSLGSGAHVLDVR
jgi:hypothetical protein